MSGVRQVVLLLVGIGVAVAAHLALDMKEQTAPRALRRNALVPGAEKATGLSIACVGKPMTRLSKDSAWRIVSPFVASAEPSAVLRLVDVLAYAPVSDEMTEDELLRLGRTRGDFGLDKPRVTVTVVGLGADATQVSFGLTTSAGDGVYASIGRSDTVYVVATNVFAAVNVDLEGFRCRRVFDLGSDGIASFDIKSGAGRFFRFVRDGEAWKLSEPYASVVSSVRVRAFLDAFGGLEAKSFVWPSGGSNEASVVSASLLAGYGLDPGSSVTVTAKTVGGKDISASFGRACGDGLVYALVHGGASVVTVPSAVREAAAAGIDTFADTRLFPMEAAAVSALSLDDGGTAYLLSRRADGVWRLDAPVSAAADPKAVGALVERLVSLRATDVDADGVRVSVGTNVAPVSVSREVLFAGMRVEDLRAKEILRLDPKSAKRVVVTDGAGKPVAVAFDADRRTWTVESAGASVVADCEAIAKLVAALHPLEAIQVARLKVSMSELGSFGLDKPFRTIAIDQTDANSVRRNILIGDMTDGGRYATLGSSDAVFVISSGSAAALLAPIVK